MDVGSWRVTTTITGSLICGGDALIDSTGPLVLVSLCLIFAHMMAMKRVIRWFDRLFWIWAVCVWFYLMK